MESVEDCRMIQAQRRQAVGYHRTIPEPKADPAPGARPLFEFFLGFIFENLTAKHT